MYKEDCSEQSILHTDAVISNSLFKNDAKADNFPQKELGIPFRFKKQHGPASLVAQPEALLTAVQVTLA